jgi:hypothetical protein
MDMAVPSACPSRRTSAVTSGQRRLLDYRALTWTFGVGTGIGPRPETAFQARDAGSIPVTRSTEGPGPGVGVNLGDPVWRPLVSLALWAVPLGVVGAAVGGGAHHRHPAYGLRVGTSRYRPG